MTKKDISDLFSQGVYTDVALYGAAEDWRTQAAKGLLGCGESVDGVPGDPEQAFFVAASHWIEGRDDVALKVLSGLDLPKAKRLAALIEKPRIKVLSQWFSHGQPPHLLHTGAAHDAKFEIVNLGFGDGDRTYAYDDKAAALFDEDPDFFISVMAEWHISPPGIFGLPCPIFAHTSDFDLHLQAVLPQLRGYDEIMVTDGSEWRDCSAVVPGPVTTLPNVFGLTARHLPPPPAVGQERDIDLMMTGTVLHPYHPDKAKLFHQVQKSAAAKTLFVNGFLPGDRYFQLMARSKMALSHVRHSGAVPTRALEALAMGCPVLVPSDSALWLYLNAEDGLVPYDLATGPAAAIAAVLEAQALWQARAAKGAVKVRRLFDEKVVASRYLRFLTVRAALAKRSPLRDEVAEAWQKRPIVSRGRMSVDPGFMAAIGEARMKGWAETLGTPLNVQKANDLARELSLINTAATQMLGSPVDGENFPENALDILSRAIKAEGLALVPRFNYIRVALHFGLPEQRSEALAMANEVISAPQAQWRVGPRDDVFPYDFFSEFFNYRAFNDALVDCGGGGDFGLKSVPLILASIRYYMGRFSAEPEHYAAAVRLDGDFPYYRLWLAKALLLSGEPSAVTEAAGHLDILANYSILAAEALDLFIKISAAMGQDGEEAREASERLHRAFFHLDEQSIRFSSQYHDARILAHSPTGSAYLRGGAKGVDNPVSTLLVSRRPSQAGLSTLQALSDAGVPADCEIVMVEPFDMPTPGANAYFSRILVVNQQEMIIHPGQALNMALAELKTPLVGILEAEDGDPLPDLSVLGEGAADKIICIGSGSPPADPGALLDIIGHGWARLVVLPRAAMMAAGGFDEHGLFGGNLGGAYELVRRLLNKGMAWEWRSPEGTGGGEGKALCVADWTPPLDDFMGVQAGPGWDELRAIWSGMLSKSPTEPLKPSALIVRARD